MRDLETTGMIRGALRLFGPRTKRVGPYELRDVLGRGASGVVYRGHDRRLGRAVAIKIIPCGQPTSARLARESRLLARVSHPNVITVFDVGLCDEGLYIVTELVDGVDLESWLARHPDAPLATRLRLLAQIAGALQFIHGHGIVHRDIKPANVLVGTDGRAWLADFGVARLIAGEENHGDDTSVESRRGRPVGTPCYMAPEQHVGHRGDALADQFAFCVTAFETLTGTRPFRGVDRARLLHAKQTMRPDLSAVEPRRLRRFLRYGMDPRPTRRWRSMAPLVDAFEAASRAHEGRPIRRRIPRRLAPALLVVGTLGLQPRTSSLPTDETPKAVAALVPSEPAPARASMGAVMPPIGPRLALSIARLRPVLPNERPETRAVRGLSIGRLEAVLEQAPAKSTLSRAYFDATSAGMPRVAFDAAILHAELSLRVMDVDGAEGWLQFARSRPVELDCDDQVRIAYQTARLTAQRGSRRFGVEHDFDTSSLRASLDAPLDGCTADGVRSALAARVLERQLSRDWQTQSMLARTLADLESIAHGADHPYVADALANAAFAELQLVHPEDAAALCRRAIAIAEPQGVSPRLAGARSLLGRSLMLQRDDEGESVVKLAATNLLDLADAWSAPWLAVRAHDSLARLALSIDAVDDAKKHAWRAYELWNEDNPQEETPTSRELLLAHVHVAEKDYEAARERLTQLLEAQYISKMEVVIVRIELARTYFALGDGPRARRELAQARVALAQCPDNPTMVSLLDNLDARFAA